MKWDNFPYLVVAYTAAVCLFVGFAGGNLAAQTKIDWISWIGATDGWLAGFVGAVTIFAILHQIAEHKVISSRNNDQAIEIFNDRLERILGKINNQWNFVEKLEKSEITKEGKKLGLLQHKRWVDTQTGKFISDLSKLPEEMSPINRELAIDTIAKIRIGIEEAAELIRRDAKTDTDDPTELECDEIFNLIKDHFSYLAVHTRKIGPGFETIFKDRNVSDASYLDHDYQKLVNNGLLKNLNKWHPLKESPTE